MNSTSPISGKIYKIPIDDDKKKIDNFLKLNKGKKVVVVQGLGFVGCAMALVVANSKESYAVIGVDTKTEYGYWKIASINHGELPLVSSDPKLKKYSETANIKQNFYATYDEYAYSLADIIIIDINLDVEKKSGKFNKLEGFDVDLTSFKNAINVILENCRENVLLLVETTVPPGTCSKIIKSLVDNNLSKRGLDPKRLRLAHSYERVMPGPNYIDSIENFYRVYSANDQKSADDAEAFFKTIINTSKYPLTRLSSTNATEIAKVLENSYRAMNIAFIQEWTEFADAAEVDLYEVISAIRMRATHQNIMRPGLGVGGYCLTKDPLLASWASKEMFDSKPLSQSEASVNINDQMPLYSLKVLKNYFNNKLINKKILFLGVSYLNDVGDTRFTPVELIYDELIKLGAKIYLHDPYLSFWPEKGLKVEKYLKSRDLDIIIVSVSHSDFLSQKYISFISSVEPVFLLDTLGFYLGKENNFSNMVKIKTIGKGF